MEIRHCRLARMALDGLDMHLYTLVAAPFVMQLFMPTALRPLGKAVQFMDSSGIFDWLGGRWWILRPGGRSRRPQPCFSLTIVTYALFTGLSSFAETWWHLLIFRFLAALGIGGEWAVGSSLISETWPKRWGPWMAAVLQTGVNIGVLLACVTTYLMAGQNPRWVFLVGILPALLVFWIRRAVPEPEEWHQAKAESRHQPPVSDLFRGEALSISVKTILVCSLTLTAWWAFQFWNQQHLRNLPELASWSSQQREQLVSKAFFIVIASAIIGNFLAGWLASLFSFRRAISLMCLGLFISFMGAYGVPRDYNSFIFWLAWIGVFSGVFGLFTMYLPPLFPTLLRTTGAGFCYNIGRIAAAFGTVFFGLFSQVGDFRVALFSVGFLIPVAMVFAWILPELKIDEG